MSKLADQIDPKDVKVLNDFAKSKPEPTTPDKLDEILKKAWEHGYYSNNYPSDPNMTWFSDDKQELTNLIQTLEQKAELYGRLHETIEAFQAGAIDADAYSKRHATLTDEIAQLEKGSE